MSISEKVVMRRAVAPDPTHAIPLSPGDAEALEAVPTVLRDATGRLVAIESD